MKSIFLRALLALFLLTPNLSWGEHQLIFDGWSKHNSKTLFVDVYNTSSKYSINASSYSFEIKFEDGTSRIYNTEAYDYCPPRNECTWRINFTSSKNPKTMRFIH